MSTDREAAPPPDVQALLERVAELERRLTATTQLAVTAVVAVHTIATLLPAISWAPGSKSIVDAAIERMQRAVEHAEGDDLELLQSLLDDAPGEP